MLKFPLEENTVVVVENVVLDFFGHRLSKLAFYHKHLGLEQEHVLTKRALLVESLEAYTGRPTRKRDSSAYV